MNKFIIVYYLLAVFTLVSCASHKQTPVTTVYDADWEKIVQAFQRSKDAFLVSDSADVIMNDLGWASRLVTDAKIKECTIPNVYKNNGNTFTIELPCWDYDSDDYMSASVIVEHNRLDSALVKAKMQGVDDIFRRSKRNETYSRDKQGELHLDSIEFAEKYADYASKAEFSCLCITKDKKMYMVNATIRVLSDEKKISKFNKNEKTIIYFFDDSYMRHHRLSFKSHAGSNVCQYRTLLRCHSGGWR